MDVVRASLRGAGMLAVVGMLAGGIGTLVAVILRDDLPGVTMFAAGVYRLLIVLLPGVVLLLLTGTDEEGDVGGGRLTRRQDAAATVLAAGLGAVAATALFLVVSTVVGPLLRRLDAIDYSVALRAEIRTDVLLLLVVCLAVGSAAAAVVARRR